jgi:hypothetical protein
LQKIIQDTKYKIQNNGVLTADWPFLFCIFYFLICIK